MTNEEAKTILVNCTTFIKDCFKYMKDEHVEQFKEAYRIAIEALEKQTPRKSVLTFKSNEYLIARSHCCPVCKSSIIEYQKFCDECGQKLDWGSVNDTIFM